ncbi:PREDICTED: telomerase-binding protein EST1A-like [Amphimedon queenslandica]|uniref:PIN domain-containing protein n=1 Tax=Amphimedon queenslandica TaxID=400682 RepID=A0A1X7VGV0_AMPQE|nr:PREDICTED: telomerase-binding protein EST1A-like [Amphimedon queenslandica]|eukprot:XP_019849056.1 PREDICTED: telomerase-binding protein EST1A-like [Amphimedon queenslandica]
MASSSSEDVPVLSMSYQQLQERKRHARAVPYDSSSSDDARSRPFPRSSPKAREVGINWEKGSQPDPKGNKKWIDWLSNERRLDRLCSRWAGSSDQLEQVLQICRTMESKTKELLSDPSFKEEVAVRVWKSCHYKILDRLRKFCKQSQTSVVKTSMVADLESFLTNSSQFYSDLINVCQKTYQFDLQKFISDGNFTFDSKTERNRVRLAVNLIHHCYLSIGDLNRYTEELKETPDWSKPRMYYLKSRDLIPRDGKPYNQLAVIAINSHRRLDAVYYYCRSLWTKNSFLSAHDSLIGLLDETAKKISTSAKDEFKKQQAANKFTPTKNDESHSREVWIMPGRDDKLVSSTENGREKEEESQLDFPELSRRLTNQFLFAHSKLFTKIGIEEFPLVLSNMISLLDSYLINNNEEEKEHQLVASVSRDASKILKMTTINISTIHHILQNKDDLHSQTVTLSLSLCLSLQFIISLLNSSHSLLASYKEPVSTAMVGGVLDDPGLSRLLVNLAVTVPSLRVWFNWVSTHVKIWEPLLGRNDLLKYFHTFFGQLSSLINKTQSFLPLRIPPPSSCRLSCSKYWEDKMLAGFSCLTSLANLSYEDTLITPDLNQLIQEQILFQSLSRLSLLQYEVTSRSSLQHFLFYDSSSNELSVLFGSLTSCTIPEENNDRKPSLIEEEEEEEEEEVVKDEINNKEDTIDEAPTGQITEIEKLKKEKDRLAQQLQVHEEQKSAAKSLIDKAKSTHSDEVTVKPKYLIPDTNCFVDSFQQLMAILESGHFVIAIPLTVIGELEGLSKDSDPKRSKPSLDAVTYVKEQLSVGSTRLKALTSQGSILSSLLTTSESIQDQSCNDDIILSSCVALHNRLDAPTSSPSLSPLHSVVLLTDDRNLRVKSHVSRIPVRSIDQFVAMLSS